VGVIRLVKAHAYGNDFLLTRADALTRGANGPAFARAVCDRHRGIGADGLITLEERPDGTRMDLLNADGSYSEVSGNGVRCVAAWLWTRNPDQKHSTFTVHTDAGPKVLRWLSTAGRQITFVAEMGPPTHLRQVDLQILGSTIQAVVLRVGNPQCVVLGPATETRLRTIAAALAVDPFFPAGTNVELAEVVSPDKVRIVIWERGVGPTESSGTGACAAAVAAAAFGGANRSVDVVSPGGTQRVEWTPDGLQLTGWAEVVGEIDWWVAD
jgi:diaminopimelate epimerase